MRKKYLHVMNFKLDSELFRGITNAVYEIQKSTVKRYTASDFIREAIESRIQSAMVEKLLNQSKKGG